jgi:hypothetical protein
VQPGSAAVARWTGTRSPYSLLFSANRQPSRFKADARSQCRLYSSILLCYGSYTESRRQLAMLEPELSRRPNLRRTQDLANEVGGCRTTVGSLLHLHSLQGQAANGARRRRILKRLILRILQRQLRTRGRRLQCRRYRRIAFDCVVMLQFLHSQRQFVLKMF